jgi:hypothetical protein
MTGTLLGSSQRSETRRQGHRNRYRDRYRDRHDMILSQEKLDVYRISIGYVAWVDEPDGQIAGSRQATLW